jgi:hypothetical protein
MVKRLLDWLAEWVMRDVDWWRFAVSPEVGEWAYVFQTGPRLVDWREEG